MCGRYSFSTDEKKLKDQLKRVDVGHTLEINFNVAPTQNAYVVADDNPSALQQMRWGLVPFWAKDLKIGSRMINARSETIMEKPAFRNAIRKRHCLVIADSFYEWKKIDGKKIPYRILPTNDDLLIMAGIWETWKKEDQVIRSFSILTCPPNQEMEPIHNRMPILLQDNNLQEAWLEDKSEEGIQTLLKIPDDGLLKMYPVSTQVNSVRNNGPHLHDQAMEQGDLFR